MPTRSCARASECRAPGRPSGGICPDDGTAPGARRRTFAFADEVVARGRDPREDTPRYLIDVMNAATRLRHLFTPGDIRNAGILPFFAGVDTVGQTLSFALYEVLRRPALLARLRAEADPVFAAGGLTVDSLRGMPVLQGIVFETLRLHPTAFGISRTAVEDLTFAGCRVLSGDSPSQGTVEVTPISCNAGERAVGGGGRVTDDDTDAVQTYVMYESRPLVDGAGIITGWQVGGVVIENPGIGSGAMRVEAWVHCVPQ